jgi:hypothetical protein
VKITGFLESAKKRVKKWDEYSKNRQRMEDHAVFKSKILTKSSTEIANAPLFEILYE